MTNPEPTTPTTKRQQLLAFARPGQKIRYNEFKSLIEHFGFRLASMNRLHNIFVHDKLPSLINLQNIKGDVKAFQIRQFINLIYRYQLRASDEAALPETSALPREPGL